MEGIKTKKVRIYTCRGEKGQIIVAFILQTEQISRMLEITVSI